MSEQLIETKEQFQILIPESELQAIFTSPESLTPFIDEIERRAKSVAADVQTSDGRDTIRSMSRKVTRSKTYLDDLGKNLVAGLKELPKKIDATRKIMRDRLDALAEEVRAPLTAYESRIEGFKTQMLAIQQKPDLLVLAPSAEIASAIKEIEKIDPAFWEEFTEEATGVVAEAVKQLRRLHGLAQKREAEAAELERLRNLQAERERKDREEQIRKEAEEKANTAAEQKAAQKKAESERREAEARLAAERASRAAEEAQQRAKEAEARAAQQAEEAAQAERDRQAAERAQEESDRTAREKDRKNRKNVNTEAATDLEVILKDYPSKSAVSKLIVLAISKGEIRHVKIDY